MERLDGIAGAGLREALLAVRRSPRPLTALELSEQLGLHRNAARSRLERLAAAGLVETAFERRSGRTGPGAGRPAKTYSATPEHAALELPARRYEKLVSLLAAELPVRGREPRLREVGAAFGAQLAKAAHVRATRRPAAAFEAVARTLRTLGFHAAVESSDARGAVIVSRTCPLRPFVVASTHGREVDRGMWRGLAAAAGADVDCETHDCLGSGACRVVLSLRRA